MKFVALNALILAASAKCHMKAEDKMKDVDMIRGIFKTILESGIKGWYNESHPKLDEKCFGPWMTDRIQQMSDTYDKVNKKGFWTVERSEFYQVTNSMWDMFFDNVEHCGLYNLAYNQYTWCLNNIETCNMNDDIILRLFEHAPIVIKDSVRLMNVMNANDLCFSDADQLKEIGEILESIMSLVSVVSGFEGKWDPSAKPEYIPFETMFSNIDAKTTEMKKHPKKKSDEMIDVNVLLDNMLGLKESKGLIPQMF